MKKVVTVFVKVVLVLLAIGIIGLGIVGKLGVKDIKNFESSKVNLENATVISSDYINNEYAISVEYDVDGRIETGKIYSSENIDKSSDIKIMVNSNHPVTELKIVEGASILLFIMVKYSTLLLVSGVVIIVLVIIFSIIKKKKASAKE